MAERLTDRAIGVLKPAAKPYLIFDSEVSGLAVKVYGTGRKAFVFDWRENGRQRRITIGKPPAWTIGKARTQASRLRLKADTGEVVKVARSDRVAVLVEQWREIVTLTRRPSSIKSYNRHLDCYVLPAFGRDDPKAITRNRVEHWHATIAQATPVQANRALAVLSAFLGWLEHDNKIERNPAKGLKRRPESSRQIFLDADEIEAAHALLNAESNRPAALTLQLTLLTGCRIGEALSLAPDQINSSRKVWIKPHGLTKQQRTHILPLQDEALAVAQELLSLGSPGYDQCRRMWIRLRVKLGRSECTIHDLRHSRASSLARNGASLPMIGKVLGHASPSVTNKYTHLIDADLRALVERSK